MLSVSEFKVRVVTKRDAGYICVTVHRFEGGFVLCDAIFEPDSFSLCGDFDREVRNVPAGPRFAAAVTRLLSRAKVLPCDKPNVRDRLKREGLA